MPIPPAPAMQPPRATTDLEHPIKLARKFHLDPACNVKSTNLYGKK
ncbi:MAG: hypothetical protein ACXQS8_04270 [Candidatus Helarchaeales archaeon]